MFAKTPVKVGPSTYAVWIMAVVTAVMGALNSGQSWMVVVSAGLVAVNNVLRSYQSIYEPELFFASDDEMDKFLDDPEVDLYDDLDEGDEPHQGPNV